MVKTLLQECKDIIRDLVGNEYLYFDHAVEIKITPHSHPLMIWAVAVSPLPKDELYVMESNEEWHRLSVDDQNASLMAGSLYQRLNVMRINYAKAS
ncbi:MAG: hypothetical protein ACJ75F_07015 [Flavisolibacter sp.]|jgi:hypothetical protein